ncbi:hypothetical protein FNV43_RR08967 [Rhamnella rubrinervis]|uniref:Uncharacterized protein n=1 Tax=Rhamnella rubrinervis TaxID=2594499 RepID=A0A8K0H9T0_9ROSA|nr:hypothetical protein FNV43_RR08967 [Rhamnella rubrinervis]
MLCAISVGPFPSIDQQYCRKVVLDDCSHLEIIVFCMERLLEFGRKALFYVRVLSGYEERRIRSFRLQLEKRVQQAQERKAALRKIPEQAILAEVRRMVEEMQNLNKKLDETEAAIEQYFKPIDKEAETLMKMQLEGEEKTMRDMVKAMQQQALLENTESNKTAKVHDIDPNQNQDPASSNAPNEAQVR